MRFWFPYPLLSLALLMLWLLLNQSVSMGHVVLGSILAISLAWALVNLQPDKPRVKKLNLIFALAEQVIVDITRSNLAVMGIILRSGRRKDTSAFIRMDVPLSDDTALAILACILTATPGTAWVEFDRQTHKLLVHVLDAENADIWRHHVTSRYMQPLKEIFE